MNKTKDKSKAKKLSVAAAAVDYKYNKTESSFNILYEYLQKMNRTIAYKYNFIEDEDIVQICALKLVERIHQFDEKNYKFHNWLYTMIKNDYLMKYKKEKNFKRNVDVETEPYKFKLSGYKPRKDIEYEIEFDDIEEAQEITFTDVMTIIDDFKLSNNLKYAHSADVRKTLMLECLSSDGKPTEVAEEYDVKLTAVKRYARECRKELARFLKEKFPNKKFPGDI